MQEQKLTQLLCSRVGAGLMGMLALLGAWFALQGHDFNPITANTGIMFPSPNLWIGDRYVSLAINVALCLGIAAMMIAINRTYNMLRSPAMIYAGLFMVFQAATPSLFLQITSSTVIGATVMVCALMLFSCYDTGAAAAKPVFLIFGLLTIGSLAMMSMALFIPIFLLGCAQMRIMNLRTILAAAFGIITPAWIIIGLGIVPIDQIRWPGFTNFFAAIDLEHALALLVTVAITATLGVAAWMLNLMKLLSYNALTRSMNGFITLLTLLMPIFMVLDYTNIIAYITALNISAAFQVSHYITGTLGGIRGERNYIVILVLLLIYISLYVWRIAI